MNYIESLNHHSEKKNLLQSQEANYSRGHVNETGNNLRLNSPKGSDLYITDWQISIPDPDEVKHKEVRNSYLPEWYY